MEKNQKNQNMPTVNTGFKYLISSGDRFEIGNISHMQVIPSDNTKNGDNSNISKINFCISGIQRSKKDINQSAHYFPVHETHDAWSKPMIAMHENTISIKHRRECNSTNYSSIRRTIDEKNNQSNSSRNNSNSQDKQGNSGSGNNATKDNNISGNDMSKSNSNMIEENENNMKFYMNNFYPGEDNEEENFGGGGVYMKGSTHIKKNIILNQNSQKANNSDFNASKNKYEEDINKKPKERSRTFKNNNASGQDNNGSSNNSNGSGSGNSHNKSNDKGQSNSNSNSNSNEQNHGETTSKNNQNTNQSSSNNPSYNKLNPLIQLDDKKINSLKFNLLNKNPVGNTSNKQQASLLQFDNNAFNMQNNTMNTFTNPKVHNNASSSNSNSNSRESSKNSVEAAIDSDNNHYMRSNIVNKINSIITNSNLAEKLLLYNIISSFSPGLSSLLNIEGNFRNSIDKHFQKEIVKFTILNFCKFLKSNGYMIMHGSNDNNTNNNNVIDDLSKLLKNKKRRRSDPSSSSNMISNSQSSKKKEFSDGNCDSNNNMPIDNEMMDEAEESEICDQLDQSISKGMKVVNCPHKNKKHYAKNMCNTCYHRQGREKKAWLCPHTYKIHYARGKCRNCYLSFYHREQANKKKDVFNQRKEMLSEKMKKEGSY